MLILTSARAKLRRGKDYFEVLQAEVEAFTKGNTLSVRSKGNLKSAEDPIRMSYFLHRMEDPPTHWGLLVGDVVQHFRSALDHAVWGLVVHHKGSKFAEDNAKKIQFPIADRPPEKTPAVLAMLPKAHRAIILAAQPYERRKDAPRSDEFWFLSALSNVDKHRVLHVISVIPHTAKISTRPALPGAHVEFVEHGALYQGAEVARFTGPRSGNAKVEMDAELMLEVRVEATPECNALPIDLGLRQIRNLVGDTIASLENAT